MPTFLLPLVLIGAGVLHIMALRLDWSWYMNNYQCRAMRQSMGEAGFAFYTYLVCGGCIALGFYFLFNSPVT